MNIVFIYTGPIIPEKGGVQRVTDVLRKYFEGNGFNVLYLSTSGQPNKSFRNSIQHYLPRIDKLYCKENIAYYIDFVTKNKIDIIINQAALGGNLARFCSLIRPYSNAKIISVIHNSLLGNVINFSSTHATLIKKKHLSFLLNILKRKSVKRMLKLAYIVKYKRKYIFTYSHSDKVVLLSSSYFNELKTFIPTCNFSKVISIANPLTIETDTTVNFKENELLYVGRINTAQKRVDLLLEIWGKIYEEFPNWKLSIIGEGPEKNEIEQKAAKMGLKRIHFYGLQNPFTFYKRSKILCMTSGYEGFSLVLTEAMYFGAVPIAFNSFAAIHDIIKNEYNGILIEPFNLESYVIQLKELINNPQKTNQLSKNGLEFVQQFSVEAIGNKWINLFNHL